MVCLTPVLFPSFCLQCFGMYACTNANKSGRTGLRFWIFQSKWHLYNSWWQGDKGDQSFQSSHCFSASLESALCWSGQFLMQVPLSLGGLWNSQSMEKKIRIKVQYGKLPECFILSCVDCCVPLHVFFYSHWLFCKGEVSQGKQRRNNYFN